jgi:hypothetical protein
VILLLALFILIVVTFGGWESWHKAHDVIAITQRETHAPNYHYIARTERTIWGEAFHNAGTARCECDMCLENNTPKYMGTTNHIAIAALAYGYGVMQDDEWRDRNGE